MKIKRTEVRSQKSEVRTLTPDGCVADLRPPARTLPERGMALVITLILLSVTLIMAVAFLAISRRERNAVTTTTDTASARLAADAALANAEAQIVANIFATTNAGAYNFGLLVSTNYINGLGFQTGAERSQRTSIMIPTGPSSDNGIKRWPISFTARARRSI